MTIATLGRGLLSWAASTSAAGGKATCILAVSPQLLASKAHVRIPGIARLRIVDRIAVRPFLLSVGGRVAQPLVGGRGIGFDLVVQLLEVASLAIGRDHPIVMPAEPPRAEPVEARQKRERGHRQANRCQNPRDALGEAPAGQQAYCEPDHAAGPCGVGGSDGGALARLAPIRSTERWVHRSLIAPTINVSTTR